MSCSAAEIAAGARYSGASVLSAAIPNCGFWQGEFLAGPFYIAYGSGQTSPNLFPITVGLNGRFPIGSFAPYLGGDVTYYMVTDIVGADIWSVQLKGGVEMPLGPFGIYAGIGYSYMNVNVPGANVYGGCAGIGWEAGTRFYFIR